MYFKLLNLDSIFGKPRIYDTDINPDVPLYIQTKWGLYRGRATVTKSELEIIAYTEEYPERGVLCHVEDNGMVRILRGDPLIHTWLEYGWIYQGERAVDLKRVA